MENRHPVVKGLEQGHRAELFAECPDSLVTTVLVKHVEAVMLPAVLLLEKVDSDEADVNTSLIILWMFSPLSNTEKMMHNYLTVGLEVYLCI